MPVLDINEDEKSILVTALTHERVRLMAEWKKSADDYDSSPYWRTGDCAEIDEDADAVTDLRKKIESAENAPKAAWQSTQVGESLVGALRPRSAPITSSRISMAAKTRSRPAPGQRCPRISRATAGCSTSRIRKTRSSSPPLTRRLMARRSGFTDTRSLHPRSGLMSLSPSVAKQRCSAAVD